MHRVYSVSYLATLEPGQLAMNSKQRQVGMQLHNSNFTIIRLSQSKLATCLPIPKLFSFESLNDISASRSPS